MKGYSKELEDKLLRMQRKERAANGGSTQKMMSFRIDAENVKFLERVQNKGRLINRLLDQEREHWSEIALDGA